MIKALLRTLFIMIILMTAILSFLLTPMGLRATIDLTAKLIPGQLSYKKISGVIIGPITIDQLRYEDKESAFDVEKLKINWNPINLFEGKLHIDTLFLQNLRVISKQDSDKWNEKRIQHVLKEYINIAKNHFPLFLQIDKANITQLQVITPTTQTQIDKLFLRTILTPEKWDVQFLATIIKPDFFKVHFSLSGKPTQYALQFSITGDHTAWELAGNGTPNTLSVNTLKNTLFNGTLDTQLKINWGETTNWQGRLIAKNINSFSMIAQSTGDTTNHLNTDNDVRATTPNGQLHLTVQYHNQWNMVWHLQLHELSHFFWQSKGDLESRGKIKGDIHNPQFDISAMGKWDSHSEKIKHATLQLNGNLENHTLLATATFAHQTSQLKMDGHFHDQHWRGTLNELNITIDHFNQWRLKSPAQLSASANQFAMTTLCLVSPSAGNACLQGHFNNQKIAGTAKININHFGWLQTWAHTITFPGGQLHADLQMNGSLQQPNISGTINLSQGNIIFPRLNVTLKNISATIAGKNHTIHFKAQAFSQNQPINLDGSIDLSQPDFLANATLTTTNALIINTDEYAIYATAKLNAAIKNKNIFVTGLITIPKATIQPNDFQTTTTLPDHDIVYVGEVVHPPKPFWLVNTDVTLKIGDHVHLNVSNVNAQLGGALSLKQMPGQDVFATGTIFVRKGTFTVYGQTLNIEPDSNLTYSDTFLNNPFLNFKASKTISTINSVSVSNFSRRELVVGIELHGSIKAPKIVFFSNRSNLSQADILSYILLGYGSDSSTPGNTDLLLRAISAVNISSQGLLGKQNIATQIQSGLGLSEMGVESDTTSDELGNPLNRQSAFVVGKHLTRNLYVRYSIGILDPVNVFQLRYLFNKQWAAQTDSSSLGNGADVLYTLEKN